MKRNLQRPICAVGRRPSFETLEPRSVMTGSVLELEPLVVFPPEPPLIYGPVDLTPPTGVPVEPTSDPPSTSEPIIAGPIADPTVKTVFADFPWVDPNPPPIPEGIDWDLGRFDSTLFKAFAGDTSVYRRKFTYGFPGASNDYDPANGYYGQLEPDGTVQVEITFRVSDPNVIETLRSQVTRLGSYFVGGGEPSNPFHTLEYGRADAWITLEDLKELNDNEQLIRVWIPFGVVFN